MHKNIKSDEEIMELIHRNESMGMECLMNQYSGLVYYTVKQKLLDREQDIEECVADVFLEFYLRRDEIDLQRGSLKAYLAIVARSRAIDYVRKTMKHTESSYEELEELIGAESKEPESVNIEMEEHEQLLQTVKDLGEPDSTIIFRRYFLSQSIKEIAEDIGMKSNSVSKRIGRALEALRSKMEDHDYE